MNNQTVNDEMTETQREAYLENLEKLGLTEESATRLKTLLEANGYNVEIRYGFYITYADHSMSDRRLAHLMVNNNLVAMSTTSSWWEAKEAKKFQIEVNKCVDLINEISTFAPTVIDPTFRDKRYEEERERSKRALLAKIEKWNALPSEEVVIKLPSGGKVVMVRHKAEYKGGYSTRFSISYNLVFADGKVEDRFWADNFVTSSGKVQRKKFTERYERSMPENDIEVMVENIKKLADEEKKSRRDF
jgi:hypothetical protein